MALPVEFYVYVGYGLFAMFVVWAVISFFLGGFLKPFMQVKRSRGKKVLVRVRNPIQDYFRAGSVEEGVLLFKDREKNTRRIPMMNGVVSRAATVFWVEVDDEKNCFFKRDTGEAAGTYDAVRVDSYITRALVRPGLFGDSTVRILLLLVILALVGIGIVGFLVYRNGVALAAVQAVVSSAGVGVVA